MKPLYQYSHMVLFVFSIGQNEISTSSLTTFWFCQSLLEMKSKNINNFTYHIAISRCLPGIKAVIVIPLTIPKLKLSCRIIILTPPWHYSSCHTNLCIAIPTEPTKPVGHFVCWKSTSSPGSHPTENRTCRKDLWAAFVLWDDFIFFRLFLFPMWGKENSDNINKMHIQGDVFHFPQNA